MNEAENLDLEWLPPADATQYMLVRMPYPNIADLVHLILAETVSRATIDFLISRLPAEQSLLFFDPDFPSPSDPGAYITVEHGDSRYYIQAGNHGWTTDWRAVEAAAASQYLWGCRNSNVGSPDCLTLSLASARPRRMDDDPRSIFAVKFAKRLVQIGYEKYSG